MSIKTRYDSPNTPEAPFLNEDAKCMVGAVASTPDMYRPKTQAHGESPLIVKLAILAGSGLLGSEVETRNTLVDELKRALEAGEVSADFNE